MTEADDILKPASRNANQGTPRGRGVIEQSVRAHGAGRSGLAAKDGTMIAGSQTLDVMGELGLPIRTIHTSGDEWVVVVRDDLDADSEEAQLLGIEDNRASELGLAWNPAILADLADAGADLSGLFYADELADILADPLVLPEAEPDEPVSVDEAKPTRCQPGDVWHVGRHTVACLDSTEPGTLDRLLRKAPEMVVADPPYGISAVDPSSGQTGGLGRKGFRGYAFGGVKGTGKGIKNNKYAPIAGDDSTDTAERAATLCVEQYPDALHFWWGANNYANALPPTTCWIVWDKETDANFADAELAWSNHEGAVRMFRHKWSGMLKASEQGQTRIHPTQKPIALFAWLYEKYGSVGDLVFDPFLGSGPSLKAAEASGRTVVGCELSPAYCDHIIAWGEAHGLPCTRVEL